MNSGTIRRLFLDFFISKGHREVPSSSLVPAGSAAMRYDPSAQRAKSRSLQRSLQNGRHSDA